MRRVALLAALCLVAGACGDDAVFESTTVTAQATTTSPDAGTTSTTPLSTAAPTTTSTPVETSTTAAPLVTYAVPADDLCVIDHLSDDALNVRSGPGTAFEVIGTLPYDGTGVHATGRAADDPEGRMWREIDHTGGLGWVASWLVTLGACAVGAPGEYCLTGVSCEPGGLGRLDVRSGPGDSYQALGSLPWQAIGLQSTGASSVDEGGTTWQQIRLRGEVVWVPSTNLLAAPCVPGGGAMCMAGLIASSPTCVEGARPLGYGMTELEEALALIGVGGPWSEIDPDAFVIEDARYFTGPEDANVVSPRPTVERWYIVGYAETDPGFRGRWLLRRTTVGEGLVAVAPHDSTGFGTGVWETCVDTCQTVRPIAGEWCDPACVEDYIFRSCEGLAPGTWTPGDCAGPPPEVLGCLEP